ncbi:MAG: DNA-directed RNA polymerase subunit alpha [Candidatus Zixiibacteriota bacterium]|jgi:DNA-directed RNA polymerase subunit alpha
MKADAFKMPRGVKFEPEGASGSWGKYVIEPLEQGFGLTLGNAIRRVLLSSIEGTAITAVKIDGVLHEYSTIPNVYEDTTEILMNLRQLVLRLESPQPKTIYLDVEGEGEVTGRDIIADPDVVLVNPDQKIATLAEGGRLKMEMEVSRGRGYVPVERLRPEDSPAGLIPVDAVFTPVHKVKYTVEETRVGQRTDYDKLVIEVWTDGSITANHALNAAARVLQSHVDIFVDFETKRPPEREREDEERARLRELLTRNVNELELSVRAVNCLEMADIRTIKDLVVKTDAEMLKYRNFGRKSLNEIKEVLTAMGLSLGMDISDVEDN